MTPTTCRRHLPAALAGLILLGLSAGGPASHAADEKAIYDLYQFHIANTDDHNAVLNQCKAYLSRNGADELAPVARGIAAWHLLKTDKVPSATALLSPSLTPSEGFVDKGAEHLAKAWLTRLDRESVRAALQDYYRKEVRYPASLKDIDTHAKLKGTVSYPKTDRWGSPWNYRLAGISVLPGFLDQKYDLSSPMLKDSSDLKNALAVPYGAGLKLTPVRIVRVSGRPPLVQFTSDTGTPVSASLGEPGGPFILSYVGANILIVCDHAHWAVLRQPSGRN